MALGDMVYGADSKATSQNLNIKPSTSGIEWVIHNIYVPLGSTCALYRYVDGSNDILINNLSYSIGNLDYHCNMDSYVYVQNLGASAVYIAYDGIVMNT